MKKLLLLAIASMMTVFTMAVGRNDGSTKANAKEFDWDKGITHDGGTAWYRVDLAPLYEEENPSLTLYLTNPSNTVGTSVDVSVQANVAGQTESEDYTIAARQYKTFTANAKMLVTLKQKEIYLTLTTNGTLRMSAKVFETADLDETCKDARTLSWNTVAVQDPSYSAWWKVSLTPIKEVTAIDGYDAKVTLTNTGSATVNLKVGQSLDCPSSGVTKRTYTLAPGEAVIDTIPRSMINSVQPDELYFGIENVESQVSILVERAAQPSTAVIPAPADMAAAGITGEEELHVTDTIVIPAGKTLYRISVADMDALAKYEPEFTYRNEGTTTANVTIKMAFERPAYGTSNTEYVLAPGEEEIVVYKKNMLEGMKDGVDSIYLLTITDQPVNFYGRFKHVREGKACKTNIDFNWETGHTQEARTTQWYAVGVADARDNLQDIMLYLINQGSTTADLKASLAFSCPYIDLQELSHSIAGGDTISRRLSYSTYAMMSDTVWVGLETSQDIRFWAETVDTKRKAVADTACLNAVDFNWAEGAKQNGGDTVWYRVNMNEVREQAAKFPTVYVQNLSTTNTVTIKAELSLECPDTIENQARTLTIEPNGTYSKSLSRNLFENIVQDEIYLRVITTEDVSLQVRLTEEAEGSSCAVAIPFNWQTGNTQAANANLWYIIDLHEAMKKGYDLKLHMQNRDNAACKGIFQVAFNCPVEETPSIWNFNLAAHATEDRTLQNSALDVLNDSVVYVNLQGTTSLRIWADTIVPAAFDTIQADGLTFIPLHWDSLYTQTVDTAWYIIPKSEIDLVRNMDEKVKPVAHVINQGAAQTITAEGAFAFPIGKKMITKGLSLKVNQHYKDTIPAGTFDQILKKDSILIRVTRPAGGADFQFRAELVRAFSGNTRADALPIILNKTYTQAANTEIWYKIKTADLKKDKTLWGKRLHGYAKNMGIHKAEITTEVYEGLLSDINLIQGRGSIHTSKSEARRFEFPAQAIYGLGDVEVYVKIKTTDSLILMTYFDEYATISTPDPAQQDAKLLVPNVDYVVPGDNQNHWYMVCLPYMQNNYTYTDSARFVYELNGTATIEGTATLQDTMTFQMPVRKDTINRAGKHYLGSKPLRELFDSAMKEAGVDFSLAETAPDFIDSMLHRYVTKDSLTFYVRIKTDNDLKVRINMQQHKGTDNKCLNPMAFDWEHGNVNPKDQQTWYAVSLDQNRIPEDKDLRLHVDNWADKETNGSAKLFFDCDEAAQISIDKSIAANGSLTKDIARDFIALSGWPGEMFINYTSDQATHIWIELIDKTPRDTVYGTANLFVCQGTDTLGHIIDADMTWNDTITDLKDSVRAVVYDSICVVHAFVLRDPKTYTVEEIAADSMPVIARGQALDVTLATQWLNNHYAADKNDTIKAITDMIWQYSTDGTTYSALTATPIASERVNLQYTLLTECGETIDVLYKHIVWDTLEAEACNSYVWEDSTYIASTLDSVTYSFTNMGDSIAYLKLTINNPYNDTLELVSKYGDRLLMINRLEINKLLADTLDFESDTALVSWYMEAMPEDKFLGHGYYYCLPNGDVLEAGTYYAVIDIPSMDGSGCGAKGETKHYLVSGASAAPALMPSLARPGEEIQIVNLDPNRSNVIRIYTSDGLLQGSYTVSGQSRFTVKAADANGFYLVELSNESMKTTLRYIVK